MVNKDALIGAAIALGLLGYFIKRLGWWVVIVPAGIVAARMLHLI